MSSTVTSRRYAELLRVVKNTAIRRRVIAMNKVGKQWLEDIKAQQASPTGELSKAFYLVKASHKKLRIEIRNDLPYAGYVEEGFMQKGHYVPGHWEGKRFIYAPGEKSGMYVKTGWVDGNYVVRRTRIYAEAALQARLEKIGLGTR